MRIAAFCIFATLINFVFCDLYSALEELVGLVDNDQKIIESMKELSQTLESEASKIRINLKDSEEEQKLMKKNPHAYVENPLNAFLLIKRLTHDVNAIKEKLDEISNQFMSKVKKYKLSNDELSGAVEGLYRLQSVYGLKTQEFANGIIYSKKYRKELKVNDLIVIGREMAKFDDHGFSSEYLELAKVKNSMTKDFTKIQILEKIFHVYNSSGMLNEAVEVLNEILELDPTNQHYEEQRLSLELKSLFNEKTVEAKDFTGTHYTPIKEKLILSKACKGELEKSIKEISQLHCRYLRTTHFTTIAPFKIIEANLNPWVVIFVDIMSEEEIETLKLIAKDSFSRAEIMVNETAKVSNTRIAKINWHYDDEHKIFEILTRRVGDMSGLNMETSELFQIQNYGIGGYYNAHYDFTTKGNDFKLGTGNRIATTLFYLSDVELGGATVFPFLRIYVPPKKGTAVYWLNLSSSGHREYTTRHFACPVIVGSKWVANKWLHEYGQEFKRPCDLIEFPTDDLYYTRMYDLKSFGIDF
ncbi:hypothetical protein PVAND_010529 [Polypedilum vanderplanki]|uniref:procollagen-proline 4-dioxygenase n=1 Tax=Polypedilum vanderplanki TaxID=319348 RepID=A0A9J6CGQ7_POLVA|nr:hypothetical protein PVAND_010529 [Polypedilum vanderplanki]